MLDRLRAGQRAMARRLPRRPPAHFALAALCVLALVPPPALPRCSAELTSILGRAVNLENELSVKLKAERAQRAQAALGIAAGTGPISSASMLEAQVESLEGKAKSVEERAYLRHLCVKEIRDHFTSALSKLVSPDTRVALVSVPLHKNYGDTFITYGEVMVSMTLGVQLTALCKEFDERCANRSIAALGGRSATIFFHGGGNFGDLWRQIQMQKWRYLELAHGVPVVYMPQSIWYRRPDWADKDSQKFQRTGHKDAHLFARSHFSFDFSGEHFSDAFKSVTLMPDVALNIGEVYVPASNPAVVDVLFLKRRDGESVIGNMQRDEMQRAFGDLSWKVVDWFDLQDGLYLGDKVGPFPPTELAMERTTTGSKALRSGRVVVTDRLHAVILSILSDIPVIALDNEYKKIQKVTEVLYEVGPSCRKVVHHYSARNLQEAAELARRVLKVLDQPPPSASVEWTLFGSKKGAAAERVYHRKMCFNNVKESYLATFRSLVPERQSLVLLGVPPGNLEGDSLRWYGEVVAAILSGAFLRAQCYRGDGDCVALAARRVPTRERPSLVYHNSADLASRIMEPFSGLLSRERVVILDHVEGELIEHKDTHLIVHSRVAYRQANEKYGNVLASIKIAPHAGFILGPMYLPSFMKAKVDVVFLTTNTEALEPRTLKERMGPMRFQIADWTAVQEGAFDLDRGSPLAAVERAMQRVYGRARLLRRGALVITDDAQAAILSILLDIPVVVVDELEGHVVTVVDAIIDLSPHCVKGVRLHRANNFAKAIDKARELLVY